MNPKIPNQTPPERRGLSSRVFVVCRKANAFQFTVERNQVAKCCFSIVAKNVTVFHESPYHDPLSDSVLPKKCYRFIFLEMIIGSDSLYSVIKDIYFKTWIRRNSVVKYFCRESNFPDPANTFPLIFTLNGNWKPCRETVSATAIETATTREPFNCDNNSCSLNLSESDSCKLSSISTFLRGGCQGSEMANLDFELVDHILGLLSSRFHFIDGLNSSRLHFGELPFHPVALGFNGHESAPSDESGDSGNDDINQIKRIKWLRDHLYAISPFIRFHLMGGLLLCGSWLTHLGAGGNLRLYNWSGLGAVICFYSGFAIFYDWLFRLCGR